MERHSFLVVVELPKPLHAVQDFDRLFCPELETLVSDWANLFTDDLASVRIHSFYTQGAQQELMSDLQKMVDRKTEGQ